MMTNIQEIVRSYSIRVKDGRTLRKIFKHAQSEMRELDYELRLYAEGLPPGEDGIVGEAIDNIACLLDIIYVHRPDISDDEINEIMERKCKKWARSK